VCTSNIGAKSGKTSGDGQSCNASTYQQIYDTPDSADLLSTK